MASVFPAESRSLVRTGLTRGFWFVILWLVLMPSVKLADLAIGMFAAIAATLASLRLLPPTAGRVNFGALLAFVPHFLWQSVIAGLDVAGRAISPSMPLRPGFMPCRVSFPPGLARNEFAAITSLLPGTVPVGEEENAIIYHCVDLSQPIAQQVADEEKRLAGALISGERHV